MYCSARSAAPSASPRSTRARGAAHRPGRAAAGAVPCAAQLSARRPAGSAAPRRARRGSRAPRGGRPRGLPRRGRSSIRGRPSERQLETGRHRQTRRQATHLLLRHRFGAPHRVVERRRDQVLEHVAVLARERRIDGHLLDVVAAGHRDLDESRPGLSLDLGAPELLLRTLHVLLHLLRLLHQASELVLHHDRSWLLEGGFGFDALRGTRSMVSGLTVASNRATRSRTNGSLRNIASPWALACSRSRRSWAARDRSPASPISNASSSLRPVAASSAALSLSE